MLSHLCFPLHTTPSEKAAADDVKCWGMYVKGGMRGYLVHSEQVTGPQDLDTQIACSSLGALRLKWPQWPNKTTQNWLLWSTRCWQLLWKQLCPSQGGTSESLSSSQIFFLYHVAIYFFSSEHALVYVFASQLGVCDPEAHELHMSLLDHTKCIRLSVLHLYFACNEAESKTHHQKQSLGFCLCCSFLSLSLHVCLVSGFTVKSMHQLPLWCFFQKHPVSPILPRWGASSKRLLLTKSHNWGTSTNADWIQCLMFRMPFTALVE